MGHHLRPGDKGRGRDQLLDLERRLNARLGNRAYLPRFDTVVSNDMPLSELKRLWWATSLQLVRQTGLWLTPRGLRDGLRGSPLVCRLFLGNKFAGSGSGNDPKWKQPS